MFVVVFVDELSFRDRRRRRRRRRRRDRRCGCWDGDPTSWIFLAGGFLSPRWGGLFWGGRRDVPKAPSGAASENLTLLIENLTQNGPFWVRSGSAPFLGSPRTLFVDGTCRD